MGCETNIRLREKSHTMKTPCKKTAKAKGDMFLSCFPAKDESEANYLLYRRLHTKKKQNKKKQRKKVAERNAKDP